jgi:Fe-S cluster assembly iron-binding protein IscA
MLTLTPGATEAIEQILEAAGTPQGAGIRISSAPPTTNSASPSPGALAVTVAHEPELGDEVIDDAGARVFLDDTVVPFLDDKLLDAEVAEEGVRFRLGERS